jgi:hypothetical protein
MLETQENIIQNYSGEHVFIIKVLDEDRTQGSVLTQLGLRARAERHFTSALNGTAVVHKHL